MRKFKKLLIGLTAVVGSAFAINAAGASGFQPAKAGYYSESDTYYHVTSESDFRDNFWNYSNLMFEDNLDFTDYFWCNCWRWIHLNNKQWNMSNNQLILEGSEWGTAAILFGGIAYANFRLYNNPTSPTLDNSGYATWFNWVYFSVENSVLTLNGNAFNGGSQIHVDGTSTVNINSINIDGLNYSDLPAGVPAVYGNASGKVKIPVVAEAGATVNITGNNFEAITVGTTTYYLAVENTSITYSGTAVPTETLTPTLGVGSATDSTIYNLWIDISNYDFASGCNTISAPLIGKFFAQDYIYLFNDSGALINNYNVIGTYCGYQSGSDYCKAFIVQLDIDLPSFTLVIPQGAKILSYAASQSGTGNYYVTNKAMVFHNDGSNLTATTFESVMSFGCSYNIDTATNAITNDHFRLKLGVTASAVPHLLDVNFGIEVSAGGKTQDCTISHADSEAVYCTMDIGAAISEGHAEVEFTLKTFVKVNDTKIYLTSKTNSIKSMVKTYYEDLEIADVEDLYNVLCK